MKNKFVVAAIAGAVIIPALVSATSNGPGAWDVYRARDLKQFDGELRPIEGTPCLERITSSGRQAWILPPAGEDPAICDSAGGPSTTVAAPATVAPSTTVAPPTTAAPPPTTVTPPTTTAAPPTTVAPPVQPGRSFVESFDTPAALGRFEFAVHHRSDHDRGVDPANNHKLSTDPWNGDHDTSCGGAGTARTLSAQNRADSVYWCREHLMTSMGHVDGYSTIAFSPDQSFDTVTRVCWDVNQTDMGGRQWIVVVVHPDFEHGGMRDRNGEYQLAQGTANIDGVDRTGTLPTPESVAFRLGGRYGHLNVLSGGTPVDPARFSNGNRYGGQLPNAEALGSRAIRRTMCVTDNGDGTTTVEVQRDQDTWSTVVPVSLARDARVVFEDHTYTPLKDPKTCASVQPALAGTGCTFTWHWDNIIVEQ